MSIVRPPFRLHQGCILIALVAAAVALVPVASSAARGTTAHHLVFRLSGPANQDVIGARAVYVVARCPTESCTVVASATSKSPSFRTAKVRARLRAGGSERLALPLARRQRGKLKAALEAGRAATLTVHATARDKAGNEVPLSLAVRALKVTSASPD